MTEYQILADRVLEGPRELKIAGKGDVIVAGGGPTGLVAAIAAAREGANVWLVESMSFLGGVATGSMMAALVASHWATGISLEHVLLGRSRHWIHDGGFGCFPLGYRHFP